jgi:regulator of sigma E protease
VVQILSWLPVIVGVVLLFGAAIFVHEFGHFLVARRCGLKVEGFSIGFGPKIIGWKRSGIDYAWRWIPAGGYVKLPQMVTSEAIEGKTDENLPPVSPGAKILVALAGPVMNAVFAFVLAVVIYFVGLPMLVNPAIIGGVEPDSPEAKMGIQPGDRVAAVNGQPVKSWEQTQMAVAMALTNVVPVTIERNRVQTTYYLTAKVNPDLGLKLLNLEPQGHPVIQQVKPQSPAESGGLKPGDVVLSFANVPVYGESQLIDFIHKRPGQPCPIEVLRGQQRVSLTVTPALDPDTRNGRLGIGIGPDTTSTYQVQKPGPAPWVLLGEVCQQTFATIRALLHSRQTGVGVKDLSGPPGILAMLAHELRVDYRLGLKFMVLLNISLGILNLLPLPVLDGGHIALAVIEKIRGRPLSRRIQEQATAVFAMLLITFMLYVSYNDVVKRFPLFQVLFKEKAQVESGSGSSNAPAPP